MLTAADDEVEKTTCKNILKHISQYLSGHQLVYIILGFHQKLFPRLQSSYNIAVGLLNLGTPLAQIMNRPTINAGKGLIAYIILATANDEEGISSVLLADLAKYRIIIYSKFAIQYNDAIKQIFLLLRNSMETKLRFLILLVALAAVAHAGNLIVLNPGCRQFDASGVCAACSNRYYKDREGICQPVSNNCRTYKSDNGACTSCYDGFSIVEDTCLPKSEVDALLQAYSAVANCNEIGDDGKCKKCSTGYYFDAQKYCKQIPTTCAKFDANIAQCTGCYQGYALNANKECVISVQQNYDLGCSKFEAGKCIKCSFGFYFNKDRVCKIIPATCNNFDTFTETCKSCYPGYALNSDNACMVSVVGPIDAGCSKFEAGKCVKCSFGYYFGKNKVCKIIPPTCGNFDTAKQICNACYPGYILDESNSCVESALTSANLDPGCNSFDASGKCVKCSFGYYFDKSKSCKAVPATCSKFDTLKQICVTCYPGFAVDSSGACVQSFNQVTDLGCAKFQNGVCSQCSTRFYFDKSRVCRAIPTSCSNYDSVKYQCTGCYPGYSLDSNKACVVSLEDASVSDLGCFRFLNGKCLQCSHRYYFDLTNKCKAIPATCSNFDTMVAICRECYSGYQLNDKNQCILSSKDGVADLNCREWKNGKCVSCSSGAYFDITGKCQIYDSLCKKFNPGTKRCQQCYNGFILDDLKNSCMEAPAALVDPNCKTFRGNECQQCSLRFYKSSDGKCKQIDPSCRLYSALSGQCTGCYDGYKLNSGSKSCEIDLTNSVTDPNCAEWKGGKCIKCSYGSFFGLNNICTNVDPLCMNWNQVTGECKGCYPSFELNNNNKCVPSKKSYTDQNCFKFSSNGECLQCSKGFYFNIANVCTQVDPLCSSFDSKSAKCLICYTGYKVSIAGKCVEDAQTLSDLNCAQFKNGACVRCSTGSYFDSNNRCKSINPQCRYFDKNQFKCGDCYPGYVLFDGDCVLSSKDNLCGQWKEGICLKCVARAYFNDQGGCNQVNEYCKDFNLFDGSCESCYGGFELKQGNCTRQTASNGCIEYGKNGACLQCQKRKYLDKGLCAKIDDFCEEFNFIKKSCTKCYKGYAVADNGNCVLAEVKTESQIASCFTYSLNGDCVECFDRFYFKNNVCNQVSVFCKKYHPSTGECTDCYTGFKLDQGKCARK